MLAGASQSDGARRSPPASLDPEALLEHGEMALPLPPSLRSTLEAPLQEIGYPIASARLARWSGPLMYDVATGPEERLALLHVPGEIMRDHFFLVGSFAELFARDHAGVFFFSDAAYTKGKVEAFEAYWGDVLGGRCRVFFRGELDRLRATDDPAERKRLVRKWLGVPEPQLVAASLPVGHARPAPTLSDADVFEIEKVLLAGAQRAIARNRSVSQYFVEVVSATSVAPSWKRTVTGLLSEDPVHDSRVVVRLAVDAGVSSVDSRYTVVGSVLEAAGPWLPDDAYVSAIALIASRDLAIDPLLAEQYRSRVRLPAWPGAVGTATGSDLGGGTGELTGPDFRWLGANEPPPSFEAQRVPLTTDVGFLLQIAKHVGSVCHIAIDAADCHRSGTGVLVAPNLVLTNHHVVEGATREETDRIARAAVLRFRFITASELNDLPGIEVRLDQDEPIVAWSPKKELDFALLRVSGDELRAAKGIGPARCVAAIPREGDSLHLLHHGGGSPLQLSGSANAVCKVDERRGLVQYITETSPGSSGAPCYNSEWHVVALHHAARQYLAWTRREGVLFSAIRRQISRFL